MADMSKRTEVEEGSGRVFRPISVCRTRKNVSPKPASPSAVPGQFARGGLP